MDLHQVVQWMMEQGYLVAIKGKYKVTAKFNKEITGQETGLIMAGNKPLVIEQAPAVTKTTDWPTLFLSFIKEAEIPTRGEGNGNGYDLNKYSDPAMKAFRKMIEKEGVMYPVLVKSTMLYYKTHRKFPYTVGRYISEGFWRSDYQALLSSAEEGTITEHIQQQIDDTTEFSRFKLG